MFCEHSYFCSRTPRRKPNAVFRSAHGPQPRRHGPQNNLAREGVERHRGVLPTCEEDCPPPASSGPRPTASAAAVAEAWPAMTIATARSFLGLVSGGMPANLCCDGGGRRHDTIMVLWTAQLRTLAVWRLARP